ncbi:MAG: VWA domain-containing protein [Gammaproteobacteria bacterium]|nr:VWA domain-containing protein [Gammaproteobacteria bacterium]
MLIGFLLHLRRCGLKVTPTELLDLIAALEADFAYGDLDQFYYLSRAILIKDEALFDRFDRAFSSYFQAYDNLEQLFDAHIPNEWLRENIIRQLSEEDKAKLQSLGDLDKLLDEFKKRLEEQEGRHSGGNKWVGTGGTSPFGHSGYHPEGLRVGGQGKHNRAVKVWDQRQYKNLDHDEALASRSIKVALKRLRKFTRTGAADELDISDTIRKTAASGGLLDLILRPPKRNEVKLLLLMDVGGSMDAYVRQVETLFSAARSEFKYLEFYYFHNCPYEAVWRDNRRRRDSSLATYDLLHTYGRDVKVIFVGDASMSPYEIAVPGGSVEHVNAEPGGVWIKRIVDHFDKVAWINPEKKDYWGYTQSIQMVQKLAGPMYPLTLRGLDEAMRHLVS